MMYHVFVDLEKAFDRVSREVIAWDLRRQMVSKRLIRLVMALYENSRNRYMYRRYIKIYINKNKTRSDDRSFEVCGRNWSTRAEKGLLS